MSEHGLRPGTVRIRSAGPMAFGPDGILFLADNASAAIYAADVSDPGPQGGAEPFDLENVDARVASYLGCEAADIAVADMAVHPVRRCWYGSAASTAP